MAAPSITSELRELQAGALARIRQGFGSVIHGRSAVRQRTELVDTIALRLWKEFISSDLNGPAKLALVAIGGYGRGILFPHSDIDILFLYDGNGTAKKQIGRASCRERVGGGVVGR